MLAEGAWLAERTAGWVCSWREYLNQDAALDVAAALRRHERTGRPLRELPFVKKIGQLLGRDLLARKPGPKARKSKVIMPTRKGRR